MEIQGTNTYDPNQTPQYNGPPPPPFSEVSAFQFNSSHPAQAVMPVFIETDIIPKGSIMYPGMAPTLDGPFTGEVKETSDGFECFDPKLESSVDEVWKYFMGHLQAPCLRIAVEGYHMQKVKRDDRMVEEKKTDFSFSISVTHLISSWNSLCATPEKGHPQLTFNQALEDYARLEGKLKQMHLTKQVKWDYGEIERLVHYIVRSTGYNNHVNISFPTYKTHVYAYSSSLMNRLAHDSCMQCLSCITCTWVILVPIYYLMREKARNKLVADYHVIAPPDQFYARNYRAIYDAVATRKIGHEFTAL